MGSGIAQEGSAAAGLPSALLRLDPRITIALPRAPAAPRSSEGGKRCALYLTQQRPPNREPARP